MTTTPSSLPWISRLVSIDTTSRDSNLPLIEVVADEVRRHGLTPNVQLSEDGTKANILITVPAADGTVSGGVVLSGHTDVVPVDDQEWTSDPFHPEVRDGRLYGRGTCDMKGFSGVALSMLGQMVAADLREPIHIALTYDEEVGCAGGAQIVKQIADLGLAPRICFVGEPSSMRVIAAHKSITVLGVRFRGLAAHSSLTAHGVNAIEYAAQLIAYVRGLADEWRAQGPYDEAFAISYTTASVNTIHGGIAQNTVPDRCDLQLEFRTIGAVDPDSVVDKIRLKAAELETQMTAENPRARVEVHILSQVPGLDNTPDSAAAQLAHRLGGVACADKVTYGTEAGQFAGAGIDTIVCGPGDIAQAHAADEYIELSQIEACERFVSSLITELSADPAH